MEKRQGLRGFWSYSIMGLEPRGNYLILRDKIQAFGADLINFTSATRVL